MSRRWRITPMGVVAAMVAFLAAAVALRWYASSQLVAGLEEIYGGRIEAERANAGWGRTELEGLRFYESDGQHVMLRVQRIRIGLTLWVLVVGRRTPEYLALGHPELLLRFDAAGNLLSTFPSESVAGDDFPHRVDIARGAMRVEQQGREPTIIDFFTARITSNDRAVDIQGELASDKWSDWEFAGHTDTGFREGSFSITASGVMVSPGLLRELPLVPLLLWEQCTVEGPVDARMNITFGPDAKAAHFKAEFLVLQPQECKKP